VGDGLAPDDWRAEPSMHNFGASELTDVRALASGICFMTPDDSSTASAMGVPPGILAGRGSPAGAARAQRSAIFQRWNC
jgi:hypothetical protein